MGKMKDEQIKATEFLGSMRGQYIISQALCLAIKEMKKVKEPHTEHSNICDMEYFVETLFPICRLIEGVEEKREKEIKKMKEKEDMKPNEENTACAKCKVEIGIIPINSEDRNEQFWICEKCDNKMGWEKNA